MPLPVPMDPGKRHLSQPHSVVVESIHRAGSEEEESLKNVWRTLRKRKGWVIGFAAFGIVLAIVACLVVPDQYQSTATVQVGKDQTVQVELTDNSEPTLSESDRKTDIATHMAIIRSNSTALAVIHDLNLQHHKPFTFHPSLIGWVTGSNARIEAEKGRPLSEAPATRERLLKIFTRKLIVKNPPDTRLITVGYLNPDPELAANIANDVVRQYVKFESEGQAGGVGLALLSRDLDGLKARMEKDQKKLADYERQTGLNHLLLRSIGEGSGGGNVTHIPVLDKLDALNQKLTEAEANRIGKEAIYSITRTRNSEVVAGLAHSSIPAIATSAVITQGNGLNLLETLRQEKGKLKLEYAVDVTKYGAKNPQMIELQRQLASVDQQISDELEQIDLRAKNDYLVARRNEDGLRAAFRKQERAAGALNQSAVTLQMLVQQAASSRQLYDSLYQQIQEAGVQAGLRATNLRITDVARPHSTPKKPNPPLYVAIGLAAGLLFGVSSAFVREHMDETVKSPLQVGPLTPLPVLASIPRMSGYRQHALYASGAMLEVSPRSESSPLLARPRSASAEAYRALRTSIVLANDGQPLRSLVVTSPLIGEGKTSVSYNTAIAFAHSGENVLLMDADLHHPHLHEYFGQSQTPGLSDFLSGGAEPIQDLVHSHPSVSGLAFLPAGNLPALPAELLGSKQFDALLKTLTQAYSLVIIDTPPMLLVTDAILLAGKADATIAVIRSDMTNRTAVERIAKLLERNGSRSIGLVLNGIDTSSVDYYHAYGHKGADRYFKES